MLPIKILTLVTGERIICAFTEFIDEKQNQNFNFYGMLIKCPYILKLEPATNGEFLPDGNPKELIVNFSKWNPYTPEKQFKVPLQHLISIAEPDPQIKEVYLQKFGEDLDEWDLTGDETNDTADSIEEPGVPDSGDRGEGGES